MNKDKQLYIERKKQRLPICKGHWLNKRLGLKRSAKDLYEGGVCLVCGRKQPNETTNVS